MSDSNAPQPSRMSEQEIEVVLTSLIGDQLTRCPCFSCSRTRQTVAAIRQLQSSLAEVRAERDTLQQQVAELALRLKPLAEMDTDGQSAMMTIPTWANVWDILKAREALAQQSPSSPEPEPEQQAGDAE